MDSDDPSLEPTLVQLGFRAVRGHEYAAEVQDEIAKASRFAALRDAGVHFERGREWSPAELFEYYRDLGLLRGPCRSLAWRGPGEWVTREK